MFHEEQVGCYCKKGEYYGAMIGCDNEHCPIHWFYFSCLKIVMHLKESGTVQNATNPKKEKQKRLYIIMLEINKL